MFRSVIIVVCCVSVFLFTSISVYSQQLSHIVFKGGSDFKSVSFRTDQQIIISISPEGRLLEWGTEMMPGRLGYFPGKLEKYMGRILYYDNDPDTAIKGKVKMIGTCLVTYFNSVEDNDHTGKVKSIGTIRLHYYPGFENEAYRGKLQRAGNDQFEYYASNENEAFRGKLKTVRHTRLSYYSDFDDKLIRGKIKSLGLYYYSWYTSFDRKEIQGSLKSGVREPLINRLRFILF